MYKCYKKHVYTFSYKLIAVFIFISTTLTLYAQKPVAAFVSNKIDGCSPLVVQFTDSSKNFPTAWFWDLGNGGTSTQQNPIATYFNPGTYNVRLIVTNANGADTILKQAYITVHQNPTVNFTADKLNGCYPLKTQFTDLSTANSGTLTEWIWDLGDGNISSQQNPLHTYVVQGSFTVTLQVKNNFGCNAVISKTNYINTAGGVNANFTVNQGTNCNLPAAISFTNSSTGTGVLSYSWNFGDGGTSTQANPTHNYTSAGNYTVTLITSNNNGCRDTLVKQNAVSVGATNANFNYTGNCQGSVVKFIQVSNPTPASVMWNFGDGTTSTQMNPQKTFANSGTFNVKLVANFGACKDSVTKQIIILPKPNAQFTHSPTNSCLTPLTVQFTNNSTGATSYKWFFGNGDSAVTNNPTYTYLQPNNYTVSLISYDVNGCTDTLVKTNAVQIKPPKISGFSSGIPFAGCAPYSNIFTATVNSTDSVVSYQWNFGDGSPIQTGNSISHTYTTEGIYAVTVIITTINGCTDTLVYNGAVRLYEKPTVSFSATPLIACANDDIKFTSTVSSNVTQWAWSFGDGGSSSQPNPTYNYTDTGYFKVTLIVSNVACRDSFSIPKYIYINPPVAKFDKLFTCDTPLTRSFIDKSIAPLTHAWSFGDGGTSTLPNPSHTYNNPGIYVVSLTVTNGACSHTNSDTVGVSVLNPSIEYSTNPICKYSPVTFLIKGIDKTLVSAYKWEFGDGNIRVGNNLDSFKYTYLTSGNFTPKVTITDFMGCVYTVVATQAITVYGPKANFNNDAGGCINSTINFTDLSVSDGVNTINTWIWTYGDGKVDTLTAPPFTHIYNVSGNFNIKLNIIDSYGCYDTLIKPASVLITQPKANFTVSDTVKCSNNQISFNNTSQGVNLTQLWNFGDNTTSTQKNPKHSYLQQGIYTIKLTVTDIFGCKDSLIKNQYITIANPVANFTFLQGDTIGLCYPYLIEVKSTANNTSSVSWSFGDGGFSNLQSPSHFYNSVGQFPLTLRVFGYGNCVDSITKIITVRGPTGTFTYLPKQFCNPGTVNFTAQTLNNASFIWDFNDGTVQTTADSIVSHQYTVGGAYKPKMILVDATGCTVSITGTDTLYVADVFTKIKVPQTTFCDSVSLLFTDSTVTKHNTVTNYLWNFGNGVTSTQKNPTYTFTQPGNYTIQLKVTTNLNCTYTDTLNVPIRIIATPQIDMQGPLTACVNDAINFNGIIIKNDTATLNWQWSFGNNTTSNLQNPLPVSYITANNYAIKLKANNSFGCTDSVQKTITIHPLPNVNAGDDTFVCYGKTITLNATGAVSYNWQSNPTLSCTACANPVVNPLINTQYVVQGTNSFGCSATDSVAVTVIQPIQITTSLNDTLCVGSSVQLTASGAEVYQWLPATGLNNAAIPNPIANPTTTTTYQVIGRDSKNCSSDTGVIVVTVYPIPQVNILQSTITANVGEVIPLTTTYSNDVTTWRWIPDKYLSCADCALPNATITDKIKYVVLASNPGGCTSRDEVTIEPLCNGLNIFIPNTFSPNGDGVNDVFYPRGKGVFQIKTLRIFNRWGEVVFTKKDFPANEAAYGWNGTYNGKQLTADVYVYTMEVLCNNNEILTFKGDVTLLR